MHSTKLLAMVVLSCGSYCFAQPSPNSANGKQSSSAPVFSIEVAPPAEPIRFGSPINISVTVTNISGKEINWDLERTKDSVYKTFVVALRKDGREVETTFFHRKISGRQRHDDPPGMGTGSTILTPYPRGKMFEMKIDLTRLYQITEPGMYTLDLSRFDDYSKTTVRSKSITFKIMPQ